MRRAVIERLGDLPVPHQGRWRVLLRHGLTDPDAEVRATTLWCLVRNSQGLSVFAHVNVVCGLGVSTPEDEQYLGSVATGDAYPLARMLALSTLARAATSVPWPLIHERAISDEDSKMRSFAATLLVNASTEDHETRVELLQELGEADSAERRRLLEAVATNIPDEVDGG